MKSSAIDQRGVSLLDTMIAVLLFATLVVACLGVWVTHYQANAQSQNIMIATYLARQLVEENLDKNPNDVVSVPRGTQPPFVMTSKVDGRPRVSQYDYAVEVSDPTPGLRNLVVRVWWQEANQEKELHLETLLFAL